MYKRQIESWDTPDFLAGVTLDVLRLLESSSSEAAAPGAAPVLGSSTFLTFGFALLPIDDPTKY